MRDGITDKINTLSKLLKFSEFERFYRIEWESRKKAVSIEFAINPSCDQYAKMDFDKDGNLVIQIRHIPETFDDAYLVAHEIKHGIKALDNQCLIFSMDTVIAQQYGNDEIPDLANRLGSMFDDPIIDSYLKNTYNFDPAHFYIIQKIPDTIRCLNYSGDPESDLLTLKHALYYSQSTLQWDLIGGAKSKHKWSYVKQLYKKRRPIVTKIGTDLYYMANKYGYHTLDEQRILFNQIVEKYTIDGIKLNDILGIV